MQEVYFSGLTQSCNVMAPFSLNYRSSLLTNISFFFLKQGKIRRNLRFLFMLSTGFNTPEVLTAYNEFVLNKNNLYKFCAKHTLKEIDNLIYFLREKNGELRRELETYDKRSSWSYTELSQEERFARPLTRFSSRPVYIAKIILDHDAETAGRRIVIRDHLSKLNTIIKTLSKTNMHLAERIRQMKFETRTPSPKPWSLNEVGEEIEMKICPPKMQSTPHYLLPLNRFSRTLVPSQRGISAGPSPKKNPAAVSSIPNTSSTHSFPSPFSSTPPSPRTAVEIPSLTNSL